MSAISIWSPSFFHYQYLFISFSFILMSLSLYILWHNWLHNICASVSFLKCIIRLNWLGCEPPFVSSSTTSDPPLMMAEHTSLRLRGGRFSSALQCNTVSHWLGANRESALYICRCESIQGLASKQQDFKIDPLLYGEPVHIDEDRRNVVMFVPLNYDTSYVIFTPLKLGSWASWQCRTLRCRSNSTLMLRWYSLTFLQ